MSLVIHETAKVATPGFYAMSDTDYHADPCPEPSLSHTIAKEVLRSPLHAWKKHPRLGGKAAARSATKQMELGSAVHAFLLGKGASIVKLPYDNFLTKDAKAHRDMVYAAGNIPLLEKDYEHAEYMADLGRPVLADVLGCPVGAALIEIVGVTRADGMWERLMIDAMTPDMLTVVDWKTCANAEPEAFSQTVRSYYTTQAAFYTQNLDALDPLNAGRRRFLFCAQERDNPECVTVHELDQAALEIAQEQMRRARERWRQCLLADDWPGYARGPHLVSPRQWEIDAELDREYEERLQAAGL